VKQKITTFFSPGQSEPQPPIARRDRKRRRTEDEDEDCVITHTVNKRQRRGQSPFGWTVTNLSNLFDFVRGKVMRPTVIIDKEDDVVVIETPVARHSDRTILTPASKLRFSTSASIGKRASLQQISKATVFDLTQFDNEEESENDPDVSLTSIRYDLTGYSLKSKLNKTPRKTSRRKPSSPSSVFLQENFRLEEKERYKQLLSQFTDVSLPEYSESISPRRSSQESPTRSTFSFSLNTESINSSPLFYQKSLQKPVDIDLTKSELSASFMKKDSDRKKYIDLTYTEPKDLVVIDEPVFRNTSSKSSTESSKTSAISNLEWIQKWRDVLDPAALERNRRIEAEERKLEVLKNKQLQEIEELSKQAQNEFPELTNEMLDKVKRALGPGHQKEVFVQGFNAEITRGDIATLRDSTWLNDEVVNFYFNLLKARSESDANLPKVHVFNTFFYPKIMKTGHAGVKRWTRKVDIFAVDVILVPVHLEMHWCLAVIDFKNKEIVYYDSLKGNNPSCIQGLKKYLADESMDKKKKPFDFEGWNELMPKDIPEQMNGCDCGVFMSKYAEYKSRYAKFTFTQENMPYFRKRMIYEILSKELL